MQLPWPFRRAQRSPSEDGHAQSEGVAAMARPARDDWRRLPPLDETLGPPPLIAPPRPFAAALAAGNPPPPILAPLSHGRSLEAPRGLVVGLARPTEAPTGGAMPPPVQRSPLGRTRRMRDEPAVPDWSEGAAAPAAEMVAPHISAVSAAVAVGPDASPVPRRLEVTSGTPLVRKAMTQAPEPSRLGPAVGLVGQPRASGASRAPMSLPAVAAVQRAPITASPSETTSPSLATAPAGDAMLAAPRLTIGQARRLGLGAPIAGGLAGATQLPFAAPGAPAAASAMATPSDTASHSSAGAQRSPVAGPEQTSELPLAVPRAVAAPTEDEAAPGPGPAASAQAPAANAAPSAAMASGPTARARSTLTVAGRPTARSSPIVSAQPLRARVQRAPLTLPVAASDAAGQGSVVRGTGAAASGAPVRIHRGGEASDLATALDARSFTHGGEIFMPASHGPLSSGKGRSLLAHEMTHVAQQRRLASSLPGEDSAHGRTLEAEAVAAERAPDLMLATRSTSQPAAEGKTGPVSSLSDSATPSAATPPQGLPQRAPGKDGSGTRTQAGTGGTKAHTHSEQELEVLAHQLYHRIGRHLRRELLVDRERAGFALDLP